MSTDTHIPGEKWEFNEDVAAVFDDMLSRSIPDYPSMRSTTTGLASRLCPTGGSVLDVGCSRGGAIADLLTDRADISATGLEISEPMIDAASERFDNNPQVDIRRHDLRHPYTTATHDVILAVLTIQFTPIEYRPQILTNLREQLNPGGALLIVEKVLGATNQIDEQYYEIKRAQGYSEEAIQRKRLSLEGVLVPLTAAWNMDALDRAGFKQIDCYWRHLNFAGWVAFA